MAVYPYKFCDNCLWSGKQCRFWSDCADLDLHCLFQYFCTEQYWIPQNYLYVFFNESHGKLYIAQLAYWSRFYMHGGQSTQIQANLQQVKENFPYLYWTKWPPLYRSLGLHCTHSVIRYNIVTFFHHYHFYLFISIIFCYAMRQCTLHITWQKVFKCVLLKNITMWLLYSTFHVNIKSSSKLFWKTVT